MVSGGGAATGFVVAVTLVFLGLHGLLWAARPSGGVWLLGSIVLALIWGAAFLRLITRDKPTEH